MAASLPAQALGSDFGSGHDPGFRCRRAAAGTGSAAAAPVGHSDQCTGWPGGLNGCVPSDLKAGDSRRSGGRGYSARPRSAARRARGSEQACHRPGLSLSLIRCSSQVNRIFTPMLTARCGTYMRWDLPPISHLQFVIPSSSTSLSSDQCCRLLLIVIVVLLHLLSLVVVKHEVLVVVLKHLDTPFEVHKQGVHLLDVLNGDFGTLPLGAY